MANENNKAKNSSAESLLKSVANKLGKSPKELEKATKEENIENLLGSLKEDDAQKIKKILSDKSMANKILATPQAQKLIQKLLGEK